MSNQLTIGENIRKFERLNPDKARVVVVGFSPDSQIRQINQKAIQRFGAKVGYTSKEIKKLIGASIWEIQKTAQ